MANSNLIEEVKRRYFARGIIGHHADCRIYSKDFQCSCGLLHDLMPMDGDIAQRLYPKMGEDEEKQFWQDKYNTASHHMAIKGTERFIEEVFGPQMPPCPDATRIFDEYAWSQIRPHFTDEEMLSLQTIYTQYENVDKTEYSCEEECAGSCDTCGQRYELVRPGKSQPTCRCDMTCTICGIKHEYFSLGEFPGYERTAGYFCPKCGPFPQIT